MAEFESFSKTAVAQFASVPPSFHSLLSATADRDPLVRTCLNGPESRRGQIRLMGGGGGGDSPTEYDSAGVVRADPCS